LAGESTVMASPLTVRCFGSRNLAGMRKQVPLIIQSPAAGTCLVAVSSRRTGQSLCESRPLDPPVWEASLDILPSQIGFRLDGPIPPCYLSDLLIVGI
jgi:hypothetical protein